jgi:heat shock protein HslJ
MSFQSGQTRLIARLATLLILSPVGTTAAAQSTVGGTTLVGPYWRAIELAGRPVPAQDAKREAHLLFQPGNRVSGSDGCNHFTGSYELKGDAITFGQLASTQMACADIGDVDRAFRDALKSTKRITAVADRLQLSDDTGKRVAVLLRASSRPKHQRQVWPEHHGSW